MIGRQELTGEAQRAMREMVLIVVEMEMVRANCSELLKEKI
jgi:hypothetical protein